MDNWNTSNLTSQPQSPFTTFLCNSNYPFTEMMVPPQETLMESSMMMMSNYNGSHQEKKRRLTAVQLESLESSFQEEIKLDPERKIKLASQVGLEPRQVAVWFQNRRARWRAKKLQHLYNLLKQEYDVVNREKHNLHEEVLKLRSMLMEQQGDVQSSRNQMSNNYSAKASNDEETVESIQRHNISIQAQGEDKFKFNTVRVPPTPRVQGKYNIFNSNPEGLRNSATTTGGQLYNIVQDYNVVNDVVLPCYWPHFPSSYP